MKGGPGRAFHSPSPPETREEAEEVEGAAWTDHVEGKSRQELQGRPSGSLAKEV